MNLVHNSYTEPSKEWQSFLNLGSDELQKVRMYRDTSVFLPAVSPTKQKLTLEMDPYDIDSFKHFAAGGAKVVDIVSAYRDKVMSVLPDVARLYNQLTALVNKSGQDLGSLKNTYFADVMGFATLKYLKNNRSSRNHYNDVVLAAVLVRENGYIKSNQGVYVFGNGFNPDIDLEAKARGYLGTAAGFGQRHKNMWKGLGSFLNINPDDHMRNYYALGRFPWWLQVLLMQVDVTRGAIHHPWLRTSAEVSSVKNPSMVETKFPYYLYGQPGLWYARLDSLKDDYYIEIADTTLDLLGLESSFVDVLKYGLRELSEPGGYERDFLFTGIPENELRQYVAGISNAENPNNPVSEYPTVLQSKGTAVALEWLRSRSEDWDSPGSSTPILRDSASAPVLLGTVNWGA